MAATYPQLLSAGTVCYISSLEKSNLANSYLKVTWFHVKYQERSKIWEENQNVLDSSELYFQF